MGKPAGVIAIAVLYFLSGAFFLLIGVAMLARVGIFMTNMNPGQPGSIPGWVAGLGVAVGGFLASGGAVNITLGIFLLNLKEWARLVTIVLSAIFAALILLGLATDFRSINLESILFRICMLGIQAMVILYLLREEVRAAFDGAQARAASM